MSLNCIIIDDEPRAHHIIKHYVDKLPGIRLLASCRSAMEAYHFLKTNDCDILFLDINMPELDGFALLELTDTAAAVIITTAYTDYAFKSYEYNAVDYLHKPIRFERFVAAIEKARRHRQYETQPRNTAVIELKTGGYYQQISTKEILYAESLGNYVKVYCTRGSHLTLITAKELVERLPGDMFARIHKSYIINLSKITMLEKEHACIGKLRIPIGKTYKIYLEQQLRKFSVV